MKKIFGYITVLLVFSWVTTANAYPVVASLTGANGVLTVNGFSDGDPSTINFVITYAAGTTVNVNQPLTAGQNDNVASSLYLPALGATFNVDFNLVGQNNIPANSALALATLFGPSGLNTNIIYGSPLSTFTLDGSTLQLLSAQFGTIGSGSSTQAQILLSAQVTSGTQLNSDLNNYDVTQHRGNATGSVTTGFQDSLTITDPPAAPEPTTMLLLSAGLLVLFGFSRKRA